MLIPPNPVPQNNKIGCYFFQELDVGRGGANLSISSFLAFFKKISAGFFGGFSHRSRFRDFGSVVSCSYHAGYEGSKFGAVKKPTRNFFN